jgi:hypothetical protein
MPRKYSPGVRKTRTRIVHGTGEGQFYELIINPNNTRVLATEMLNDGRVDEYNVAIQRVVDSDQ